MSATKQPPRRSQACHEGYHAECAAQSYMGCRCHCHVKGHGRGRAMLEILAAKVVLMGFLVLVDLLYITPRNRKRSI